MTLLLFATIVLVVIVLSVVQLLADVRFRRTRPTPIADCRDGQRVKVVGRAVALATTTAPFSERPCVAWRITATMGHTRSAKTAGRAHIDKFIVKDDSGEATVDPTGVTAFGHGHLRLNTDFDTKFHWTTIDSRSLPGLELLGLPTANQATEAIVAVGELVAVRARVVRDPETGAVRLVADQGKYMVVTDQPRLIGRH